MLFSTNSDEIKPFHPNPYIFKAVNLSWFNQVFEGCIITNVFESYWHTIPTTHLNVNQYIKQKIP